MALSMFDLSNPDIDFCALAKGMGVRVDAHQQPNNSMIVCILYGEQESSFDRSII